MSNIDDQPCGTSDYVNFPFLAHAGAEDPFVYTASAVSSSDFDGDFDEDTAQVVMHAVMHDEQITRCADGPIGCWPGGRHAFSVDNGRTWEYSAFDAWNGTVAWTDGGVEELYLRARPHLLLDE